MLRNWEVMKKCGSREPWQSFFWVAWFPAGDASFCRALCVPNITPTQLQQAAGLERVKKDQGGWQNELDLISKERERTLPNA